MNWLFTISIVISVLTIIVIFFDIDRSFRLYFSNPGGLIENYGMKQKNPKNRTVAYINLKPNEKLNEQTIKSLMDQSIKLHDLAIQTNTPEYVDEKFKNLVSIHKPNTEQIREMDVNTIVIPIQNGVEYSFDHIESFC
ncbi:153R [Cherax quadricarinatus iridovirus]|uniref:Uncharacterized protein n=1 Tax=Shrimp hemocyte iridescent virus TaxID=2039780 RepID=A0A291B0H8_9VIRU|nr:153R [Cherax quadricarinatus iridovirus]YP_010084755.1 hypothetical protein KM509_gp003 [Shrimp hemocyte iridescent virus]UPA43298.1 hypothetical protein 4TH000024 [Iridovirus CN01]ASZ85133.1 153R [Cherax quadricarinatus iridovirus]ATE87012.1 hypothetical protein [Shrimp hemocyte iridescent virus]UPA43533.1 hypothetical protein 3TG000100 [Iridovirus CN01]UPA43730.1 hypothetical protein 1DG000138 [Iridovirus CN01]